MDLSCPDWWEKLQAGEVPIPHIEVDETHASESVALFDSLRIPDVPGRPTFGEVGAPWGREIVRALFGALDLSDPKQPKRLINELFLLIPKKNSKTTNTAALGVVWLTRNRTAYQSGVIVAPTKDAADTCFSRAAAMVELDPELREIFHVQQHQKTLTNTQTKSTLKVKSFDMSVLTGAIPAFVVIDELHVLSTRHYAQKVLGQIRGGMISNPMAMMITITTQSTDPPMGVFKTDLEAARRVRDGKVKSQRMLPVLYEFPESVQLDPAQPWRDPKYWPYVLPNLDRSVRLDLLLELYEQDRQKGPAAEQLWLSQHLNIQIGLGVHDGRWVGADYWEAAADPSLNLQAIIDRSEVLVAGYDGGGLDDLAALAVFGRCATTKRWLAWFHAWAYPDVLKARPQIAELLRDFEHQGDLTICDSGQPQQEFRDVTDLLIMLSNTGKMPTENAIGFDPWGVHDLGAMLEEAGLGQKIINVPQGYKLSSAIWGMERKLRDGMMRHCGRPMMNWVLGNAKSEMKGGNVYVSKSTAGKAKIDPLVAGFNAYALMSRNPVVGGSYLEHSAELVVL
jgi:phage terminase large subunit-like protein